MNILKRNAIMSIFKYISHKQKELEHVGGFLYFDKPVKATVVASWGTSTNYINRVDNQHFYYKEQILPKNWSILDGATLLEILEKVKNNEFFIMKNINGVYYKMKLKTKINLKDYNDQHQPY